MFTSHRGPVKPDWQVQAKALSMSVQEPRIENLAIKMSSSRSFPGLVFKYSITFFFLSKLIKVVFIIFQLPLRK